MLPPALWVDAARNLLCLSGGTPALPPDVPGESWDRVSRRAYRQQGYAHWQVDSAGTIYLRSYSQPELTQAHLYLFDADDGYAHAPVLPRAGFFDDVTGAGQLRAAFHPRHTAARYPSGGRGAPIGMPGAAGRTRSGPVPPAGVPRACALAGQR